MLFFFYSHLKLSCMLRLELSVGNICFLQIIRSPLRRYRNIFEMRKLVNHISDDNSSTQICFMVRTVAQLVRSPVEQAVEHGFDSRFLGIATRVPHRVPRWCECVLVCVCEVVCISLSMTRSETSQAVSSALSPVSVGAQNSYMTPQCSWVLSKKMFVLF